MILLVGILIIIVIKDEDDRIAIFACFGKSGFSEEGLIKDGYADSSRGNIIDCAG